MKVEKRQDTLLLDITNLYLIPNHVKTVFSLLVTHWFTNEESLFFT